MFVGPDFVITVRHAESPELASVRRRLESNRDLLRLGPEAVLYAILDKVVDGYAPVVAGLINDIDEIETEVFRGDPQVSRRIYELSREVVDFQRATHPLVGRAGRAHRRLLQVRRRRRAAALPPRRRRPPPQVIDRVDDFRQLLSDMLTVNATLVAQQQNEEMKALTQASNAQNEEVKKISAWAAILFAPTLIGTVYGMNFEHMPELDWRFGYPLALALMLSTCLGLYAVFKRRDWL